MTFRDKILHFNKVGGVEIPSTFTIPNEKELTLTISLIKEELKELEEALNNKDNVETLDALGDLLWVVERATQMFGVNSEELIERIYQSNMSKFTKEESIALETLTSYSNKGIPVEIKFYNGWFRIQNSHTGKILKMNCFEEPKLEDLCNT